MAYDFTADSDAQTSLSKELNNQATNFETEYKNLYSEIDGLSGAWVGEDYDAFNSGTHGYETALGDLKNGIDLFSKHFARMSIGTDNLASELVKIIQNATQMTEIAGSVNPISTEIMSSNYANAEAARKVAEEQEAARQAALLEEEKKAQAEQNNLVSNANTSKRQINTDNIDPNSRVARALNNYSSEIDNAEYVKIDDNIFLTITPTTVDGNKCYLTHVVINNPNQIFGEPANGNYGTGLETATSAASRLGGNTALVLNGSHFSYADGTEDLKGENHIVIVNGQIKTNGNAGGMEICLDNQGNLFNAAPGTSAQTLVDNGVVYTFSSHDSHLISNGNKTYEHQDGAYNSTVIGQKEACDYYFLTGSTSNFGAADYLYDKGCTFAKSMDQGGSVSLVYNGELLNNPTDNTGERAIGDFLCISS